MKKIYLTFLCIFTLNIYCKVLIITHSYNRPDFIELQYKTFKKLLKDDYEFVVFNDAERNQQVCKAINNTCRNLGIRCIQIPQAIHDKPYLFRYPREDFNSPCCRCANVVQYSLDTLGFNHNDIVVIIDSDMFLVKEFSIRKFLDGYDIAGLEQSRGDVTYLWNGIVFMNMDTLPNKNTLNWNCGLVNSYPCDVGGHTYYYFQQNSQVKIKSLGCEYSPINNTEFFINKTFFHYRGGTNWDGKSPEYHQEKTNYFNSFINNKFFQQ